MKQPSMRGGSKSPQNLGQIPKFLPACANSVEGYYVLDVVCDCHDYCKSNHDDFIETYCYDWAYQCMGGIG